MGLLPILAIDDALNLRAGDMKFGSQPCECVRFSQVTNCSDAIGGQFGLPVFLAGLHGAMLALVVGVFFTGAPYEVFKIIIQRVSVKVSCLVSRWARATKCLKDKAVYTARVILT